MALKVEDFNITPKEYSDKLPSDTASEPNLGIEPSPDDLNPNNCPQCKGNQCRCNGTCSVCKAHKAGLHKINDKVESLISISSELLERDLYSHIRNKYWEVTSFRDQGHQYMSKYPKMRDSWKPDDLAYILKRSHTKESPDTIKSYKDEFDRVLLPTLSKEFEIVSSGPEYYHFRPKATSKVKGRVMKLAHTDIGRGILGSLGSLIGIPGLSLPLKVGKEIYKAITKE